MHVCIDYRPALHEATGVGTYVRGLLSGLTRRFPAHRYTALSASLRHRLRLPFEWADEIEPVDIRLPVRLLDWMWHRTGWPPVELWTGPIDIAHSPSPMLLPARRGRRLVTIHDCYFLRHPEDVAGTIRRDYVPLTRRAAQEADGILTVSETTKDEIVELLGIPSERVHVTHLGVESHFHPRSRPDAEERARLDLPTRYLLFVGRREPRKNLPVLLLAFERVRSEHPDVELVLVGPPGHRWERTWADAPATVREATVLQPHRQSSELPAVYAGAEALLLPSRWEGFGLTALEAMATGTPVVAARTGALPEVLGDAAAWVDPDDPDELAATCARVLEDREFHRRLAKHGKARASRYSWIRTAERTEAAYRRVLAT